MGAFWWTALIMLFLVVDGLITTWGNVAKARALAELELEIAKLRTLPPGDTGEKESE